jgi:long-subunit fatty acid transport protein
MKKIILGLVAATALLQANIIDNIKYEASIGKALSNYNSTGMIVQNDTNGTTTGKGFSFTLGGYKDLKNNNESGIEISYSDIENTEITDLGLILRHNYTDKFSWNVGLLYSSLDIKNKKTCKEFGYKLGLDYKINEEFSLGIDYKDVRFDVSQTERLDTARTEFNLNYHF